MYAVAIVLIQFAKGADADLRRSLLIAAGMLHADAGKLGAACCPKELRERFDASADTGRDLLLTSYVGGTFVGHVYFLAALSAFAGFRDFARLLEGFDRDDGHYWHVWSDDVIREP